MPEIARLGQDFGGQIALATSLHAADDETRSALMPINRKYPLAELMGALRAYPLPKRRRITIEYTLVAGKNDTEAEAKKVARLLRGLPVKVNLIPMNPIGNSPLGPPDWERVLAFQRVLVEGGYSCFVRKRRGDDVAAACGCSVCAARREAEGALATARELSHSIVHEGCGARRPRIATAREMTPSSALSRLAFWAVPALALLATCPACEDESAAPASASTSAAGTGGTGGTGGAGGEEPGAPAALLGLNDVSVLFPLPSAVDAPGYLVATDAGARGVLSPRTCSTRSRPSP